MNSHTAATIIEEDHGEVLVVVIDGASGMMVLKRCPSSIPMVWRFPMGHVDPKKDAQAINHTEERVMIDNAAIRIARKVTRLNTRVTHVREIRRSSGTRVHVYAGLADFSEFESMTSSPLKALAIFRDDYFSRVNAPRIHRKAAVEVVRYLKEQ